MLKLKPETPETITEEIEITVPGQKALGKFTGCMKFRDKEEFAEFLKWCRGKDDVDMVMEIFTGWSDVDGEFSRDNVAELLKNHPPAAREIVDQYSKALFRSRVKN